MIDKEFDMEDLNDKSMVQLEIGRVCETIDNIAGAIYRMAWMVRDGKSVPSDAETILSLLDRYGKSVDELTKYIRKDRNDTDMTKAEKVAEEQGFDRWVKAGLAACVTAREAEVILIAYSDWLSVSDKGLYSNKRVAVRNLIASMMMPQLSELPATASEVEKLLE